MQGTPNDRVLDLNALLAERRLEPVEVKLGDDTYMVNTDLTAAETQTYLRLWQNQRYAAAFTLLVGTREERDRVMVVADRAQRSTSSTNPRIPESAKAKALGAYLETLPRMHQALVSATLLRTSKALAEFAKTDDEVYKDYGYGAEPAGESTAS